MPRIVLYLLGSLRIECDGVPVNLETAKAKALLVYLAVAGWRLRRESLVNLLWPDSLRTRGRALLRNSLYFLNRGLQGRLLSADSESVGIDPDADLQVDAERFRSLIAGCRTHGHSASAVCPQCSDPLGKAVELYRGDFLSGFGLKDSVNFDDWQLAQTEGLRSAMESALDSLIRCLVEQGELARGIGYAQSWLGLDRANELAHRHLMDLLAKSGKRTAALRQYRQCVRALDEELGATPDRRTVQLYEDIKAGHAPEPAADPRPGNFPHQRTSFVGRQSELTEIRQLFDTTRLLTLTGAGGCGKTRLRRAGRKGWP